MALTCRIFNLLVQVALWKIKGNGGIQTMSMIDAPQLSLSEDLIAQVGEWKATTLDHTTKTTAEPLHPKRPVHPHGAHVLDSISNVQQPMNGQQARANAILRVLIVESRTYQCACSGS